MAKYLVFGFFSVKVLYKNDPEKFIIKHYYQQLFYRFKNINLFDFIYLHHYDVVAMF